MSHPMYYQLSYTANVLNSFKSNCTIVFGLGLIFLVFGLNTIQTCSRLIMYHVQSNTLQYYIEALALSFFLCQCPQQLQIQLHYWVWLEFGVPCTRFKHMFKIEQVSTSFFIQYTTVLDIGNNHFQLSCFAGALNSFKSKCTVKYKFITTIYYRLNKFHNIYE